MCTGVLKTLEKLAKKYKFADMSLESFRANLKSKYTADKIASQHNVQISNGSRLILVPEIPVPLANRVIIVSKSMGSEQRGYSGLWGNSTGTNDKGSSGTMCAPTITPPTTAQKYMDSAESCKAGIE